MAQRCKLENRRRLVPSPPRPIFFSRIDDSHCDRIHSSFTAVQCFNNGYVGKHPLGWKEYCAEYWLKELQESMDRCTGHHDITEILLKMALNTSQSINLLINQSTLLFLSVSFLSVHWSILLLSEACQVSVGR